ncbi:hypothetical protein BV22DRAFT_994182, partial [Leucogyrophana mollusca]
LGFRDANYVPRVGDYEAYLYLRDELLHSPRGRAALMKGGIIGRLASEDLDHTCVLNGPSDSLRYGNGIAADGTFYWDDDLSPSEQDLICGVYKVSTGQGQQTKDLSWWPKQSTWQESGFDYGYWTPDNEAWYRKRLELIRQSDFARLRLQTAADWRNSLKKYKTTHKFIQSTRKAAVKYL